MQASIGKIASPAQGVGYFEKDGYYARDDGADREASAWAGRGAAARGLSGPVDPETFRRVLEGEVSGGRRLGRREFGGEIVHRPGPDVTLSGPKSVSLMAILGGDERIVEAHDKAPIAGLEWLAARTGLRPIEGGRLTLRPFPTVTAKRLATVKNRLRLVPWPRANADLRTVGVRGEEAAEHLRETMRGR